LLAVANAAEARLPSQIARRHTAMIVGSHAGNDTCCPATSDHSPL
jgi:hypothetical protein